jgi:hypothetical protein
MDWDQGEEWEEADISENWGLSSDGVKGGAWVVVEVFSGGRVSGDQERDDGASGKDLEISMFGLFR